MEQTFNNGITVIVFCKCFFYTILKTLAQMGNFFFEDTLKCKQMSFNNPKNELKRKKSEKLSRVSCGVVLLTGNSGHQRKKKRVHYAWHGFG